MEELCFLLNITKIEGKEVDERAWLDTDGTFDNPTASSKSKMVAYLAVVIENIWSNNYAKAREYTALLLDLPGTFFN